MAESGKRAVIPIPNFIKVLIGINQSEEEGNIKTLSDLMELSYSTVSRLVLRFESKEKWVRIKRHKNNPANNKIKFTSKGKVVHAKAVELLFEMGYRETNNKFIRKVIESK